jgi:SH3 domain protein
VRFALPFLLFSMLMSAATQAQDIRYISDKQYIPLRSGAGTDYRITHRGLPSGTRLTVKQLSADGEWAEITTDGGSSGWMRAQYLMTQAPAQTKLEEALRRAEQATQSSAELQATLDQLETERGELLNAVTDTDSELETVADELTKLKQISGKALQLDQDNQRLVVASETLRSEVEMLQSENQRLQDKLDSEDFLNGALAVFLGVIITLVVPRLWPKRRKSSSWA